MKIDFIAQNKSLIAAPDGAVATLSIGNASEVVGVVVNHTSKDGYTVATFATPIDGQRMPIIEMTRDNAAFVFKVINESVEEFYATENRGEHFNFYKQLCERNDWVFDASTGLNSAYWTSGNYIEISDDNSKEIARIATASREQFAVYVRAVRSGPVLSRMKKK